MQNLCSVCLSRKISSQKEEEKERQKKKRKQKIMIYVDYTN